jgi:hypothetical protein
MGNEAPELRLLAQQRLHIGYLQGMTDVITWVGVRVWDSIGLRTLL